MAAVRKLILIVLCFYMKSVRGCPMDCTCLIENGKYSLNCNNWDSVSLRNLPNNTQILTITGGKLNTLDADSFKYAAKLEIIRIEGTNLKKIEAYTFNGLKFLALISLKNNQISALYNFSFNHLTSLTRLELVNNKITTIPQMCFNNLPQLKNLGLDKNKITAFEEETFEDLKNLEYLVLSGNKLVHIKKNVFKGLTKLILLALNDNLIEILDEESFKDLRELHRLLLDSNKITKLLNNNFIGLQRMNTLNLHWNQISTIESGAFSNLDILETLNIERNSLSSLNGDMFSHLKTLKLLDLRFNKISEVTYTMLSTSFVTPPIIKLNGNPLNCSCNTFASLSSMSDHVNISNGVFKTPLWLEGMHISKVNEIRWLMKCHSHHLCYNSRIGCLNNGPDGTVQICPQEGNIVNCACVQHLPNGIQSCSEQFDCRTYGCGNNKTCSLDMQRQWNCVLRHVTNTKDEKTTTLIIVLTLVIVCSLVVILFVSCYFKYKMRLQTEAYEARLIKISNGTSEEIQNSNFFSVNLSSIFSSNFSKPNIATNSIECEDTEYADIIYDKIHSKYESLITLPTKTSKKDESHYEVSYEDFL